MSNWLETSRSFANTFSSCSRRRGKRNVTDRVGRSCAPGSGHDPMFASPLNSSAYIPRLSAA